MRRFCTNVMFVAAMAWAMLSAQHVLAEAGAHGIARVADPPPGINGDLDRLGKLAGWVKIEDSANVTFGGHKWAGPDDLSGSVIVGWDPANLYIGARVTDDHIVQKSAGEALWKGDHLLVVLDVPRQEGTREKRKVYQFGISPGNFQTGPGAIAPEVFEWIILQRPIAEARVAALRTPTGYQIEAAIPWAVLGVKDPAIGLAVGFDVMLSDSDNAIDPDQDKVMSLLDSPWNLRDPGRMVEGLLADGDGVLDPKWIKSPFELIQSNITIGSQSQVEVAPGSADASPVAELVVRARIDYPQIAGGNPQLQVRVNGTPMNIDRVRNRLSRIEMGNNLQASLMGDMNWFVVYAPSYDPIPEYSEYATPGVNPFEFRFDVSDLWKPAGGNRIELLNVSTVRQPIVAEVGTSERLSTKLKEPELKPAPTGEIPTIVPVRHDVVPYTYEQLAGGAIAVTLGEQKWVIESAFSTTTPGWASLTERPANPSEWRSFKRDGDKLSAGAPHYDIDRTIIRHDDRLQIIDRITNNTNEDQPVMVRHQARVDRTDSTLYLNGLPVIQQAASVNNGAAPTTLILWESSGLGFVSEDDLTRAQGYNFVENDAIGIRNPNLVVAAGKTVEIEFSVYPLETSDRFSFINRIRRHWDVNFTIDGSGMMVESYGQFFNVDMPDDVLKRNIDNRAAKYAMTAIWNFNFPDLPTEPTEINIGKQRMVDRFEALSPETERIIYYHAFAGYQDPRDLGDGVVVAMQNKHFGQDKIMRPDGSHADYSNPQMPLYLPVEGSAWAKAQEALIPYRFKLTRSTGHFWDEMEYSAYKYDYNPDRWDGVSADIDTNTHKITRKITNVALISQPWRIKIAKEMMSMGPLIGNGAPFTRSFGRLHFPRFVETGALTYLASSQLYTPIALGDHLTERNEIDCYRNMVKGLDYGAVYYWYHPGFDVTHPTLSSYMFPITPVNLGHGYIIGEERILTNRSGLFGWDDGSEFEAIVFDRRGYQSDEIDIPRIERDGKIYAEIRIPEGYAVALIRK